MSNLKNVTLNKPAQFYGAMHKEGLVSSNGKTTINVLGGAQDEFIIVQENGLSFGTRRAVLPDVSDTTRAIKKMLQEGRASVAKTEFSNTFKKRNYNPQAGVNLPIGALKIKMKPKQSITNYERKVDFETGEITVAYSDGLLKVSKNAFVSRASDMFVYEISKSGTGNIDAELSFDIYDEAGTYPIEVRKTCQVKYDGQFIFFSAKNDDGKDFGAVLKIERTGGTYKVEQTAIKIAGAEKVFITGYAFSGSSKDKEFNALKAKLVQNKSGYDRLLKEHAKLHEKLYDATMLNIHGEELSLINRLFNYGKYMLAITNKKDSHISSNAGFAVSTSERQTPVSIENTMLNVYYAALYLGQSERLLTLFNFIETNYDDLRKNATRIYAARGVFVPSTMLAETALVLDTSVSGTNYISGNVDVADLYYQYATETNDSKFLRQRALPFMKDASMFYVDYFRAGIYTNNNRVELRKISKLLKDTAKEAEAADLFRQEVPQMRDALATIEEIYNRSEETFNNHITEDATAHTLLNSARLFAANGQIVEAMEVLKDIVKFLMQDNLSIISNDYSGNFFGINSPEISTQTDVSIGLISLILELFVKEENNTITIWDVFEKFKKFNIEGINLIPGELALSYDIKSGLSVKFMANKDGQFSFIVPRQFKRQKGLKPNEFDARERRVTVTPRANKTTSFTMQ
ncbi:MAG: glycoside hydrolase family 95 protein [Firmicutes bacterium]|nr:glycoside hydrolase family 95 protein [Bacillota bacterium]